MVLGIIVLLVIVALSFFFINSTAKSAIESQGLRESDLKGAGLVVFTTDNFEERVSLKTMTSLKNDLDGFGNNFLASSQEKAKASIYSKAVSHDLRQRTLLYQLQNISNGVSSEVTENCAALDSLKELQAEQDEIYFEAIDIALDENDARTEYGLPVIVSISTEEDNSLLNYIQGVIRALEVNCGGVA